LRRGDGRQRHTSTHVDLPDFSFSVDFPLSRNSQKKRKKREESDAFAAFRSCCLFTCCLSRILKNREKKERRE
jgi:hypothetical protein